MRKFNKPAMEAYKKLESKFAGPVSNISIEAKLRN
jgi:hypothetical protein